MKKSVLSLIIILGVIFCTISSAFALTDINTHWAKGYIEQLVSMKAIYGYTDGTFKPDNKITRAEFTAILLRALNNDVGNSKTGYWADSYINEAIAKGYIKEGEFDDIKKNITRGEIARMIVRAMNETYPDDIDKFAVLIKDYSDISWDYKYYVLKAFNKGIITGRLDGSFGCEDNATRAEASTMIVRLVDKSKRILPDVQADVSGFIEPQLGVEYNYGESQDFWYKIRIDNIGNYNSEYQFKVEIITYPELNIVEVPKSGREADVSDIRQWITAKEVQDQDGVIHVFNIENWKNGELFNIEEDTEIQYKITVKKGTEEKQYDCTVLATKQWMNNEIE